MGDGEVNKMDDQELISKKELLEQTGISYGQLYRWKRKQLIPEEWFIRRATFTGQETYFPRALILPRIERIRQMKDDLSLEELAGRLSPFHSDILLGRKELILRNIVTKHVWELYASLDEDSTRYSWNQILYFYTVQKLLLTGDVLVEEGVLVLQALKEHYGRFADGRCDVILLRKMGISICLLAASDSPWYPEAGVKLAARLPMEICAEELNKKLG
jgi:DNA-binding transcriptional MerR regulator